MKTMNKAEMQERLKNLESQLQDVRNERKAQFNKYAFIQDLTEFLKSEIENDNCDDEDRMQELIDEQIDNECIYYRKCFEIAMDCNFTDWTDNDMGMYCKNISQVAYIALVELVNDKLDRSELIELIEEKQNS